MATLPQLIEDDIHQLDEALRQLIKSSDASVGMVIDNAGFLLTHQGDAGEFDLTTIAALASGAYLANQTIANLIHEENFNSVYQQGEKFSMLGTRVNEETLLLVIFEARVSVGAVKYFCGSTVRRIAAQLVIAHERDPDGGLDLSMLNAADTSGFFKKR
jgi:predicted regulator of Ras-like GTPase activity (Roadblock/LC7/MglB family)